MNVIVGADATGPLPDAVVEALRANGHDVTVVGPIGGGEEEWATVGAHVGRAVADKAADVGVVMCWSGTGVCIAANKVPGVRAAQCADAETARLARKYNHANVLVMSMRATTDQVGTEILEAFLSGAWGDDDFDRRNVAALES